MWLAYGYAAEGPSESIIDGRHGFQNKKEDERRMSP
jgi:hypothetical protein